MQHGGGINMQSPDIISTCICIHTCQQGCWPHREPWSGVILGYSGGILQQYKGVRGVILQQSMKGLVYPALHVKT
jgi:hypothetical protein